MTTIGKLWTAGIAYVALAAGAGLSIMYNVVDTMTVRGPALDIWDVITAVAAPAIVLLMVEMFVSRIWIGQPWHIQVVRWLATLAIGGVAMRTSWTHGHDFMASRGQSADVATLWPLAIDLLAIMATALILAGRVRGHVAMAKTDGQSVATGQRHGQSVAIWAGPVASEADVAESEAAFNGHAGHDDLAMATQPLSEEYAATLASELDAWGRGHDLAIRDAGQELAAQAERYVNPRPVPVATGVPDEARTLLLAWDPAQIGKKDVDALLAAHFGKSDRVVRRWRSIVCGTPTSGGSA
jgi:hypothetical protein